MTSPTISKKTMLWVSAAHVLVLLFTIFFAHVLAPTPPPKMLEMIGLPENTNPAEGIPSAQSRGPETPNPQPPTPTPPQAPQPPPTQPANPQPTPSQPPQVAPPPEPPPQVPVRNDFPTVPTPPKPPKPVKPTVNVNLTQTTRTTTSTVKPTLTTTQRNSTGTGISSSSIEQSLSRAVGGGDPNAGVRGGSRNGTTGSLGSPNGNVNGDWYRSLIKNTLERHWMKPQSDNPNLVTTVKIRILADGTIQYVGMTNGSGNVEMDNSVVSAVRAAGKMSIPPPEGFPKPYEDTVIFKLRSGL